MLKIKTIPKQMSKEIYKLNQNVIEFEQIKKISNMYLKYNLNTNCFVYKKLNKN